MAVKADTNTVHTLCQRYKILGDVESDLEIQVGYLRIFKKNILPNSQTETQRAKTLQQIETLAAKLKQAVEGLTFSDRSALDDQFFFGADTRVFDSANELIEDVGCFDLAGSLIPCIEAAAKDVRGRLQDVGQPSRPKVTERQADYIRCIAQTLKRAALCPPTVRRQHRRISARDGAALARFRKKPLEGPRRPPGGPLRRGRQARAADRPRPQPGRSVRRDARGGPERVRRPWRELRARPVHGAAR